jgi:hypothetical protein
VLERAMTKTENYKRWLAQQEKRELKKAKTNKDKKHIKEKFNTIFDNVYDRSLIGLKTEQIIIPTDKHMLLEALSRRYLFTHPKYGVPMIIEAYHEYYGTGAKCDQCGRTFTQPKKGRNKRYCSDACRQKAYRWRNKRK